MKRLLLIATLFIVMAVSASAGEIPISTNPAPPPPPDEGGLVQTQQDTKPSVDLAAIVESVKLVIITHFGLMR